MTETPPPSRPNRVYFDKTRRVWIAETPAGRWEYDTENAAIHGLARRVGGMTSPPAVDYQRRQGTIL